MAMLIKQISILGEMALRSPLQRDVELSSATDLRSADASQAIHENPVAVSNAVSVLSSYSSPDVISSSTSVEGALREIEEAHAARLENERKAHQAKLVELEEKAIADGYAKGLERGELAGRAAYEKICDRFNLLIEKSNDALREVVSSADDVIGAIVFETVCQIVGASLHTPEGVRASVEAIIDRLKNEDIVGIKVSPYDFNLLTVAGSLSENLVELPLDADDSIEHGGCVVHLKGGRLDGRIETQFRMLAQSLKNVRSHV